ncbi:porin [Burkholderia gladioli]|nr:porin [Burkholderia gladioli pv. gladioli]AWY54811.1 porin [Burkholderia gladioli pv. gladioli]PEH37823.1 porin [Burkholderia gladioli]QPQ85336.1 porin [Burkholderia gladioli]
MYLAISGVACAQSSVTLSGLLGTGIAYSSNSGKGGAQYQMNGTHAVPFWSLSGREELDSDSTALFRLAQYAFLNNGGSSPLESYLGLKSIRLGTITLGLQYDLLTDMLPYTSERWTSLLATHPGNLDRTVGTALPNLIKYKSPVFGGALQFGAQYGFGQQGSTTNTGRTVGAEASFTSGSFQSLLVWQSVDGVPYAPYTRLGVSQLYGINFAANPTRTVSQNQNTATVGVAYSSETVRVMGNYSYTHLTAAGQSETAQTVDVGAYKYITTQMRIGGGYSYTKLDTYKWNQVHAHVDYALSKRTSLYALSVLQLAGSGQLAVLRNQAPASTSRQIVFEVGMTHLF